MKITLRLSEDQMALLLERFEQSKQEYPNLSMDAFISWAVRYYLDHAYKDELTD